MNKKATLIVATLMISCLLLCSCGGEKTKTISGSVPTVVKECQEVANNERVMVQVTGNIRLEYIQDSFTLIDGPYRVSVILADSEKDKKGPARRVTVKGLLMTFATDSDSISITDAVIV